eukprot:TCALIF_10901-PA protein Name:"Similar to CdGAPr GTPase-activating protein CdGAPr (Drosophila melanogaster)" AED:0.47 eAED:0.47 QI:0/0/0/0.37/0.85/0.75/8/0/1611
MEIGKYPQVRQLQCPVHEHTYDFHFLLFQVGDMISVIDMPPPDESIWWRGKRGFEVGFFPGECVEVIGDKVPHGLSIPLNSNGDSGGDSGLDNDSADSPLSSGGSSSDHHHPTKPVLRKHGKLISFFRSFILSRPSRGKLKKSGILKERVFGCDLSEHLLNTGQEACLSYPCRVAFDEDRVPNLHDDRGVLQDIHSVSSLVKMYFRELPNPICTYHLYEKFVEAAKAKENQRLVLLRDVVQQLPPPNYRTLEYLSRHLYRVSLRGGDTGMTAKNVAIVWAPNLLRSKSLEVGGVAALQGVGVQAVVTEYLIRYCELIFSDKMPVYQSITSSPTPKKQLRPKSLAISTPTKLLSLDEARNRALSSAGNGAATTACGIPLVQQESQRYIEVGGGPEKLPPKYHTVIDLPSRKGSSGGSLKHHRRSPIAWKNIFSGRNKGKPGVQRKLDLNDIKVTNRYTNTRVCSKESTAKHNTLTPLLVLFQSDINSTLNGAGNRQVQTLLSQHHHQNLRPVRSAESLIQPAPSSLEGITDNPRLLLETNPISHASQKTESAFKLRPEDISTHTKVNPSDEPPTSPNESRPISMDLDELAPLELVQRAMGQSSIKNSPRTHSRSSSHDSYFERKLSAQFKSGEEGDELLSPVEREPSGLESNLDLSEIQMNFELEDNEMRIFSEDEATMMSNSVGSDMNKSPLDEYKQFGGGGISALKRAPKILEGSDEGSPKARKMSFREKFKRFTSPTPNRKETPGLVGGIVKEPEVHAHHTSLKDKIVGALSPESLRKKPAGSEIPMMYESPQIPLQSTLATTSTTTSTASTTTVTTVTSTTSTETVTATATTGESPEDDDNVDAVASSNGLPLSPSINFIDASMHESLEKKDDKDSDDINSPGENTPDELEEEFDDDQQTVISASSLEKKLLRQDLPYNHPHHHHHHQQQRLSVASRSTNEDLTSISSSNSQAQTDQLVIAAQIHHVPIIEEGFNHVRQEQFPIIETRFHIRLAFVTAHEETQPVFEPDNRVNELSELEDDVKRKPGMDLRVSPSLSSSYHPESSDESVLISSPSLRNPHLQTVQASIDTLQSLVQDEGSLGCISPIPTSLHNLSNSNPTSCTQFDRESDHEGDPSKSAIIIEEIITETFDTAPTNLSLKVKDKSDEEDDDHDELILISSMKGEYLKRDTDPHMEVDQPEKMDYDESVVSAMSMALPIQTVEKSKTNATLDMSAPIVYQAKTSTHIVRHVALPDPKMAPSPTTPSTSSSSKGFSPSPTLSPVSPAHPRLALVGPTPYQRRPSVSSVSSCEDKPSSFSPSPPIPKPRNISKPPTPKFDIIANDIPLDDEPKLSSGDEEGELTEEKAFSLPPGIDDMDTGAITNSLSMTPPKVKEKRLTFSEPAKRLTVSKSVDRIEFKTRLSTTSLHAQIEEEHTLVNEEPPLQRRNSIHNVPFVDVSDPQTRERMERYKEERRSMLRAKYKVEDYKTKKVSVEEIEPPKPKARRSVPSSPTLEVPPIVLPHKVPQEENRPVEHVEMRKKKSPMMEAPKPRERSFNGSKKNTIEDEVNVKERAAIFGVSKTRENKLRTVSLATPGVKNNNRQDRRTSLDKSPPGAPSKIKNMAAMFEQK